MVRVALIGNHRHTFCSEAVWARAFTRLGCEVLPMQVDDVARDPEAAMTVLRGQDLTTYTRTHSPRMFLDESWSDRWRVLEAGGTKTVGLHLDLFWGLERQHLIGTDAQFTVGTLFTADGGHQEEWTKAGIRHEWFPPGVDAEQCALVGRARPEWTYDVIFLGSGPRTYHPAYAPVRAALIDHLRDVYGPRFAHVGHGGDIPVQRGQDLADLLAGVKIVAGDSCFANEKGSPRSAFYWSDRCPEILGRSSNAMLLHPWVPGLRSQFLGSELATYVPGDWDDFDAQAGGYLANPGEREGMVERGRRRVLKDHIYDVRLAMVLERVGLRDPVLKS